MAGSKSCKYCNERRFLDDQSDHYSRWVHNSEVSRPWVSLNLTLKNGSIILPKLAYFLPMVMRCLQRKRSTFLSLVPTFLTSLLRPYLNTISGKEMSIKYVQQQNQKMIASTLTCKTLVLNGCLLTEILKKNPFSFSKMLVWTSRALWSRPRSSKCFLQRKLFSNGLPVSF